MALNKVKTVAQIVGFVTMGLLAVYGLLVLLQGAPAWAAGGPAYAAPQAPAAGTVPGGTNFQGYLRDDEGNLMSGYYTMTFTIYDDAVVGTSLWSEQQISVTVRDGYFSVLLGDDPLNLFPTDLFTSPDRYIGVTVDPYTEMVPRQRFASVPYAFHADRANGLSAADGDPQDAVSVNDAGTVTVEAGNVLVPQGGMCLDSDGSCNVPGAGELRVSGGGIHGGDSSGQNLYLVPGSGNVGVGTQSPSTKLDVAGGARVQGSLNVTSANGDVTIAGGDVEIPEGGLCVDSDGGCNASDGELKVGDGGISGTDSSGDNVYLVPGSGNVSVGYASTQALSDKLEVNGNISWSGHLGNMVVSSEHTVVAHQGITSPDVPMDEESMVLSANSICFLTAKTSYYLSSDSDYAICYIGDNGTRWYLAAQVNDSGVSQVECRARCLQW